MPRLLSIKHFLAALVDGAHGSREAWGTSVNAALPAPQGTAGAQLPCQRAR